MDESKSTKESVDDCEVICGPWLIGGPLAKGVIGKHQ